jgi:hypothetical protein
MEPVSRLGHTLFYVTVQVADMKSGRWIFFTFAWLGMVLYFTQRWIFGPVIPTLMTRFGVDKTSIGLIGSASIWGYMLTPILAGLISDRFGRKYAVLAGIIAGLYGLGQFLGRPVCGGLGVRQINLSPGGYRQRPDSGSLPPAHFMDRDALLSGFSDP